MDKMRIVKVSDYTGEKIAILSKCYNAWYILHTEKTLENMVDFCKRELAKSWNDGSISIEV